MSAHLPKPLFFDVAATHPQIEEGLLRYQEVARSAYGNASSSHAQGLAAAEVLSEARRFFAGQFGVSPEGVIFTSSGSEANNQVITGFALKALAEATRPLPEIVTTVIEHPCVMKSAMALRDLGFIVHLVPVTSDAQVDRVALGKVLSPSTGLVSIMQLNNIVGAVLPVQDIAKWVKERAPNTLFHSDTVQAYGRVELPKAPCEIDFISISAHKIGGPKGIGALIALKPDGLLRLRPLILGAGQEFGFRAGTVPVELIAAFHTAAEVKARTWRTEVKHAQALCEHFRNGLEANHILGRAMRWNSPAGSIPHIACLSLLKGTKRDVLEKLSALGGMISGGAACSSLKPDPDPVLMAMGLGEDLARGVLRVSFSKMHSEADVDALLSAFATVLS